MMNITQFQNLYSGKKLDFDGIWPGQCVDLAQYWWANLGLPRLTGNAIDIPNNHVPNATWVPNGPTNFPHGGDLVIFGAPYGTVGGTVYGHVVIALPGANANAFNALSQNDPAGSTVHSQPYHYGAVKGWWHPHVLDDTNPIQPLSATLHADPLGARVRAGAGINYHDNQGTGNLQGNTAFPVIGWVHGKHEEGAIVNGDDVWYTTIRHNWVSAEAVQEGLAPIGGHGGTGEQTSESIETHSLAPAPTPEPVVESVPATPVVEQEPVTATTNAAPAETPPLETSEEVAPEEPIYTGVPEGSWATTASEALIYSFAEKKAVARIPAGERVPVHAIASFEGRNYIVSPNMYPLHEGVETSFFATQKPVDSLSTPVEPKEAPTLKQLNPFQRFIARLLHKL